MKDDYRPPTRDPVDTLLYAVVAVAAILAMIVVAGMLVAGLMGPKGD